MYLHIKLKDLGDPRGARELTDTRGGTGIEKTEKGDIHGTTSSNKKKVNKR